ncbi:MAG: two-component system response regulator [Curvibacter sp.]|nr:MAG: two-component system response regulator [Curvibacter sp.]
MDPAQATHTEDTRNTILVVDDTSANLAVMGELLSPLYRVRVANSGQRALAAVRTQPRPDLILLDIMMPGLDGYSVLERLQADPSTRDIPVIFVTAMSGDDDEERGLSLGAVDYVAKPIRAAILLARVRTHLELKQARDGLRQQNENLEQQVQQRTEENELIKDVSLNALALLAEKRDNETGNHLHRTQAYVELLIEHLREHPRFAPALRPPYDSLIAKAAPLHDIGKVGIADQILLKPGRLTPEEFEVMKTHSQIGADALQEAIVRVQAGHGQGSSNSQGPALEFLQIAQQIALSHHEKWNGSGYPRGLAGDDIPVAARLMALADVFDALTCKRHYKEPFPIDRVVQIITEGRGQHFDPEVVDAFLALQPRFVEVAMRYADIPPRHALG